MTLSKPLEISIPDETGTVIPAEAMDRVAVYADSTIPHLAADHTVGFDGRYAHRHFNFVQAGALWVMPDVQSDDDILDLQGGDGNCAWSDGFTTPPRLAIRNGVGEVGAGASTASIRSLWLEWETPARAERYDEEDLSAPMVMVGVALKDGSAPAIPLTCMYALHDESWRGRVHLGRIAWSMAEPGKPSPPAIEPHLRALRAVTIAIHR